MKKIFFTAPGEIFPIPNSQYLCSGVQLSITFLRHFGLSPEFRLAVSLKIPLNERIFTYLYSLNSI